MTKVFFRLNIKLLFISLLLPSYSFAEEASYSLSEFTKSLNLNDNNFSLDTEGIVITEMGKAKLTINDSEGKYTQKLKTITINSLKQIKSFLLANKITNFSEFESIDWNIIFRGFSSDENNRFNSQYFHYALVGPPADIVLDIRQFIKDDELNTKELKKTLIHEFSHVVEYVLLGKSFSRRERWHAEGFAVWMTSKILNEDNEEHYFINSRWKTIYFTASPQDYYYSYLIFKNIEDKYGIDKIFEIYRLSQPNSSSFKEILTSNLKTRPEDLLLISYYRN